MIAKKTKFRVSDILEVINCFCDVSALLIAQRKTLDLKWFKIYNKWERDAMPKYKRIPGNEHWSFGRFIPTLYLTPKLFALFCGHERYDSDNFYRVILPYVPEEMRTRHKVVKSIQEKIVIDDLLGKPFMVDEESFIIKRDCDKYKKRRFFDEDFHPTYLEASRYRKRKMHYIYLYWQKKKAGEYDGSFSDFVYGNLTREGFQVCSPKHPYSKILIEKYGKEGQVNSDERECSNDKVE